MFYNYFYLQCWCGPPGKGPPESRPAKKPTRKLPKDMEVEEYRAASQACAECKQNVDASHWCDICNGHMHGHCGLQMYDNEEATRGPRRCSSCQAFSKSEGDFCGTHRKFEPLSSTAVSTMFSLVVLKWCSPRSSIAGTWCESSTIETKCYRCK